MIFEFQCDDVSPEGERETLMSCVEQAVFAEKKGFDRIWACLLYTSPSPRDQRGSRMPSSA